MLSYPGLVFRLVGDNPLIPLHTPKLFYKPVNYQRCPFPDNFLPPWVNIAEVVFAIIKSKRRIYLNLINKMEMHTRAKLFG